MTKLQTNEIVTKSISLNKRKNFNCDQTLKLKLWRKKVLQTEEKKKINYNKTEQL